MQTPVSLYNPIIRRLPRDVAEIRYEERYIVRPVRKNGTIRWKSREVFITEVLRRERIGLSSGPEWSIPGLLRTNVPGNPGWRNVNI